MSTDDATDVLMVTYNRPQYTRLALGELLERSDESMRIWVWHNGQDEETLEVVRSFRDHPQLHRFHHSQENLGLSAPTNWLFENAKGAYLSKVDDDCIVPEEWGARLREVHEDAPTAGVLACWHFQEEDFVPELAEPKIKSIGAGHRLLVNLWVPGSGWMMKRACVDRFGKLRKGKGFTDYCVRIARSGWVNGWLYPFLYQDHMDDPRSKNTGLKTDEDMEQFLPLSAKRNGVTSIEEWLAQLKRSARIVQEASIDPAYWSPLRWRMRTISARIRRALTRSRRQW